MGWRNKMKSELEKLDFLNGIAQIEAAGGCF